MSQSIKQQSNSFSTGGGGTNFETRIQAAFTVLMLTGRISPCLPPHPITKLKLQGSYAGFNTDDFIVFSKQPQSEREARLLAQIKHDISITKGNETFAEVIQSTWADFNDGDFDSSVDSLALITGPLSATDIKNVRPILEWARHSENEQEFLTKVDTPKFSSDAKRKKLAAFKTHLKTANGGKEVSDKQLWEFLKAFHLIGYDLDADSGSTLSLLQSLIAQYSKETVSQLWARIVGAVQEANQNAGTLTLETIAADIRTTFDTVTSLDWSADVQKLRDHGRYILGGIKTTIGGVHIKRSDLFAEFLEMTETSNFIFVSGERGSGKSSLIEKFSEYIGNRAPIFCLRIEDLDKPHLDNVFSTIGLRGTLTELEAGFALMPKKYLIIESLEKLLELNFTNAFSDLLHLLNQNQGWTVIATGRDYAYQPISFNYLQPSGINFSTLALQGFSQNQIRSLYEQVQPLQQLAKNQALQPLLKIPFFADLACRVIEAGAELKNEDGEKEFRVAVWRNVIAKEQERTGGMPLKRKRCFIDIAIKRAKQMVYGVPEVQFDEDTLLKLEEDNLVSRNLEYGLVSPAHDVLEDWALEQYIEESYQSYSENVHTFLDAIGDEPAISRAFRLWLHQKLRYGDNINDLILSILEDGNIQRYWQDEAIVALLQGDNPDEFLSLLKERLLLNDGELLKRFCFILRIACQTPDPILTGEERNNLVDTLYLKPYGNGWKAIIGFLFKSRNLVSEELTPHITAVLSDWASIFNINEEIPELARQTGLLALHLLNPLKDLYQDDGERKKLLKIIIKTSPAIPQEFLNLLIEDIFAAENKRLSYVEDLCNIAFQSFESAFFCKYSPSIIMMLFLQVCLIKQYNTNLFQSQTINYDREVEECFGVYKYKFDFYPPSGARGPFQYLLKFHPKKGLDFILKLLNTTTTQYINSGLDAPKQHSSELTEILPPIIIKQLTIQLNDGTRVNQYCSSRLWSGYRGISILPNLLQSALMALENWLISYTKYFQSQEELEWIFDYILRNTNSVMPTAVLASVATGFPAKLGRYALPLLRTAELYFMDTQRSVHDYKRDINWLGLRRDALSRVCEEERRVASQRPWRQKTLETLAIDLQLLQLSKDDVFAAMDTIRSSAHQNKLLHFLLQRIDTRNWQFKEDRENNRILIKPQELEPNLHEIQQKTQEQTDLFSRFCRFNLFIKDISDGESLADKYLKTWKEVISEARELLELLGGWQRFVNFTVISPSKLCSD
ncbi:MAG: ATP-binding protein [Xenococcus sp. MO_188.B8]|nr:ATP-binding protein [Xenococcus sp. MO_188.B8]